MINYHIITASNPVLPNDADYGAETILHVDPDGASVLEITGPNDVVESDRNSASAFSCYINLSNTILGSGLLGLPYAFSRAGWSLGVLLIVLCGALSGLSLHFLAECAMREQDSSSSFYSVAGAAMPQFTSLIDIAVALKCFGVSISYLIVIGDLMPHVMSHLGASTWLISRYFWIIFGFFIVAPLSFLKNLDSLKITSALALFFIAFLTSLVVLFAFQAANLNPCQDVEEEETCVGEIEIFSVHMDTMRVFSIFIFGFTCHQNIFSVKNELRNLSLWRMDMVIMSAIVTTVSVSLVIACFGYYTYGSNVKGDILVNYPEIYLTSIARIFVAFLVAFSYPLQAHPARKCLLTLWSTLTADESSNKKTPIGPNRRRYVVVTCWFLALSLMIALITNELSVVLSIVGATGSTMVSYILPGFTYYLTFKDDDSVPNWKVLAALFQGSLGILIVPLCLIFIFV